MADAATDKPNKKRFASLNNDEYKRIIEEKDSKNTKRATDSAVKTFKAYLVEKGFGEDIQQIPTQQLDAILAKFYTEARAENGELYKRSSLFSIRHGLNRYFAKTNVDIIHGADFTESKQAFVAATKEIKRQGKGCIIHYPPVEESDILKMYQYFDLNNNVRLQEKIFVDILLYFSTRRSRKNIHEMKVEDFAVSTDADDCVYIYIKSDEVPKSQQDIQMGEERMYAVPDDPKCPVKSFMKYKQHLDDKCHRLFQRPSRNCTKHSLKWYDSIPLGHNTISNMMPTISEKAGLSTRYTNHSLRATVARILDSTGKFTSRFVRNVNEHEEDSNCKRTSSYTCTGPGMEKKMSEKISDILRATDVNSVSNNDCQDEANFCTSLDDDSLGDPRCPVNTFKAFARRRPPDTVQPDSRFYLSPLNPQNQDRTTGIWYTRQPLGKNRLGYIMKTMTEKGELSGRKVCPVSLSCTPGKSSTLDVCQTIQGTESEITNIVQHIPVQQTQTSGFSSPHSSDNTGAHQYRSILMRPSDQVTSTFDSIGHVEPDTSNDTENNSVIEKPSQKSDTLETVYESPDHQKQILNKLYELWKEEKLCDAALSIGSEKVQVHKAVLMANCPYVLNLCLKQNKDPVLDVKLPPYISLDGLKVIVQYFYLGILKLTAGNVLSVEKIAKYLEMKDIYSFCRSYRSKLMSSYTSDNDSSDSDCDNPLPNKASNTPPTIFRKLKRKSTPADSNTPSQVSESLVHPVSSRATSHSNDSLSYEILFSSDRSKMFCVSRDGTPTESATDISLTLPASDISENCSPVSVKQEPVDDFYHHSDQRFVNKDKNLGTNRETAECIDDASNMSTSDNARSSKYSLTETSDSNKNVNNSMCSLEMEVHCKQEPEDRDIDYERVGKCANSTVEPISCRNTGPATSVVAPGVSSSQVTNMVYVVQSQPVTQTDPKQIILTGPVQGNRSVVLAPVINTPQVRQNYRKVENAPKPILPNLPAPTRNIGPSNVPYPVQVIPNMGSIQQSAVGNPPSFIPKQT